jgi:hypothetical protein
MQAAFLIFNLPDDGLEDRNVGIKYVKSEPTNHSLQDGGVFVALTAFQMNLYKSAA